MKNFLFIKVIHSCIFLTTYDIDSKSWWKNVIGYAPIVSKNVWSCEHIHMSKLILTTVYKNIGYVSKIYSTVKYQDILQSDI